MDSKSRKEVSMLVDDEYGTIIANCHALPLFLCVPIAVSDTAIIPLSISSCVYHN